jgi:hypothetical protein
VNQRLLKNGRQERVSPADDRPRTRFAPAPPLLLGGVVATLVALCATTAWPSGSMVAAQPASAPTGDLGWVRIFALAQAAAFGLYGVTLLLIRRTAPGRAAVLILAVLIQLLPVLAPLMLSSDVWSYWNAGRIAVVAGGNPYVDTPATFPDDPSFRYTSDLWRHQTTAYGPAFTVGSEAVAAVAGDDAATAAWLYKAGAGMLMVALTLLVSTVSPRPAFAAAFVGWNPVFAIQFAGSGHNDVLMITLAVAGILLGLRGRSTGAGTAWSVGVFLKWLPIILLPVQLLEDRARHRRSILPGFVIASLALAAVSTWLFGVGWLGAFVPFVKAATGESIRSLAIWPRLGPFLPETLVTLIPLALFGVAYLFLIREAWRGRARRGLTMGLFLLASPYLWTWYVISPAALSAAEDVPGLWLALALCAYTSIFYLGDVGTVLTVFGRG